MNKLCSYEDFKSLTNKQLSDIALMEASWEQSGYSDEVRNLLAALAHRIRTQLMGEAE